MSSDESAPSLLLTLPDPCLLAVLQCCADDQHTLFSAARAHSRLHQAAVLALRSITAVLTHQQQADGVCMYLAKYGQAVDSIHLKATRDEVILHQLLPPNLRLHSLQLEHICLRPQPGDGFQGVLGLAALKQLRLSYSELLPISPHSIEGLSGALSQLPHGLEHLCIVRVHFGDVWMQPDLPSGALQQLQQLTYLELGYLHLKRPSQGQPTLQALQMLPHLAKLRLASNSLDTMSASFLSDLHNLTSLELSGFVLKSGGLSGSTQLQHLALLHASSDAAGVAQMMSQLHPLQQLTESIGRDSYTAIFEGNTLATAAYSALTASSKLQRLQFSSCRLPSGVWQYMFPAGRQLPDLQVLDISGVKQPWGLNAPPQDGSCLLSCCRALQHLDMRRLQYRTKLLAPLTGLSGLRTLLLAADDREMRVCLRCVS